MKPPAKEPPFLVSLVAGGLAGTSVDISLYPIDTIKTRLQSPQGFINSGGFRNVYKGVSAVAIGSWPGAALFFVVYEDMKVRSNEWIKSWYGGGGNDDDPPAIYSHMISASAGEVAACLVSHIMLLCSEIHNLMYDVKMYYSVQY